MSNNLEKESFFFKKKKIKYTVHVFIAVILEGTST